MVAATLLDLKAARLLPSGKSRTRRISPFWKLETCCSRACFSTAHTSRWPAWPIRWTTPASASLAASPSNRSSRRCFRSLIGLGAEQFAAMAALAMAPKEAEHVDLGHLHVPKVSVREQAP